MPDIGLIVTIVAVVLAVITILALGLGLLYGFKRNVFSTVARFIALAIAVVLAFVAATAVAKSILDSSMNQICNLISEAGHAEMGAALLEYLQSGGAAVADVKALLVALVAPVVFAVVFLVADIVLLIISAIVCACVKSGKTKKKTRFFTRLILIVCNVAMGFLIASFIILPVSYYADVAGEIYPSIKNTVKAIDPETGEKIDKMVDGVCNNVFLKLYTPINNLVAASMTKITDTAEESTTLKQFLVDAAHLVDSVSDVKTEIEKDENSESSTDAMAIYKKVVDDMAALAEKNPVVDDVLGLTLRDAVAGWLGENGQGGGTFLSFSDPFADGDMATAACVIYQKISESDMNKLSEQLALCSDTIEEMQDIIDVFSNGSEGGFSAKSFHELATSLQEKQDVDALFGDMLKKAADTWSEGGSFCGISNPLQGNALAESFYSALKNEKYPLASTKLNVAGTAIDLANIMLDTSIGGGSQEGGEEQTESRQEQVDRLVENLTTESAEIITDVFTADIITSVGGSDGDSPLVTEETAEAVSKAVDTLVNGLLNMKDDETMTEEEKNTEKEAVAAIFDVVHNTDDLTTEKASEMVSAVKDSTIVNDVLKDLVSEDENGNKSGAFDINVNAESEATILGALEQNNITADSAEYGELYQNIVALFGLNAK